MASTRAHVDFLKRLEPYGLTVIPSVARRWWKHSSHIEVGMG